MNIKQAEELTGITQQNIRFYERQGLLCPARNAENGYREYSAQDIRTLKLIKLLRKLKMPVEQIAQVLHGKVPLNTAMEEHLKLLEQEKDSLADAISFCQELERERLETLNVDEKLSQIANREKDGSVFGNIAKDFMAVAHAEALKEFSFSPDTMILDSPEEFTEALFTYANQNNLNLVITKESMYPEFTIDGLEYTAERHFSRYGAVVTCRLKYPEDVEPLEVSKGRRKIFSALLRLVIPVCLFLFLVLTRLPAATDTESVVSILVFSLVLTLIIFLPFHFWFPQVKG